MNGNRSSPPIPPRWLNCPRKSLELVGGKFLAFKTPLDTRYDDQVPIESRFPPQMLISSMKSYKVKIGLWIDLTNTSRFYQRKAVQELECRYVKVQCRGHGETPSAEQVQVFIDVCRKFIQQNPLEIIAVHCTHGFNRTGFLISSYLIEAEDWSPEAAISSFAKSRPPGIYKQEYITELFSRYGDIEDAPAAPELPDWCFDSETGVDEDGNPINQPNQSDGNGEKASSDHREKRPKKEAVFMEGVSGVTAVTQQPKLSQVQKKVQQLCGWKKGGFPGCQPVSMDRENLHFLSQRPYMVSWKADGTRYMMLIDGPNGIFFVDRDNAVFQVERLTFLHRKDERRHLSNTLLDGEMVIDEANNQRFPRFLVYDIIKFEGVDVGLTDFGTRMTCIQKEIIGARNMYIQQGKIDKTREPFSVRHKQFWDIGETATLLGHKFTKETLGHEPDGLIFQPSGKEDVYHTGRDDTVLKWKPPTHNSVDFKLRVVRDDRPGMIGSVGELWVGGLERPFAEIKVTKSLKQYNNKIIECKWENNQWVFMRERTDKSYANGYKTAQGVCRSIAEPVTNDMLLQYIATNRWQKPDSSLMPPPPKMPRRA